MSALQTLQDKVSNIDKAITRDREMIAHHHFEIGKHEDEVRRLVREKDEHLAAIDRLKT